MLRWPASARLLSAPLPCALPTSSLVLPIRTYATPGRPKSVVGEPSRPVKRAVKRAAAKPADGTSPAEKKLAASKRKAAAARRRPELTEEQKAAQQERLQNARAAMKARQERQKAKTKAQAEKLKTAELKTVALEPPPRAHGSGYTMYTSEKIKAMGPLGKGDTVANSRSALGARMKEVANNWKGLGPAEVEVRLQYLTM